MQSVPIKVFGNSLQQKQAQYKNQEIDLECK